MPVHRPGFRSFAPSGATTSRRTGPAPKGIPGSRGPGPSGGAGSGQHHPHHPVYSNFLFNPFFTPTYFFYWSYPLYPFYPACNTFYPEDEWSNPPPAYTNENLPAETSFAEAQPEPEGNVEGEAEAVSAPPSEPQTIVVEMANGITKTFTWYGDKLVVTQSKTAPEPQEPPAQPTPPGRVRPELPPNVLVE